MSTNHEEFKTHASAGKWTAWLAAVLVLYLFSIGPVAGIMGGHVITGWPRKVIDTVYRPLVWVCEKGAFTSPLDRYEAWWEDRMNGPYWDTPVHAYDSPGDTYIFYNRPGSSRTFIRGLEGYRDTINPAPSK